MEISRRDFLRAAGAATAAASVVGVTSAFARGKRQPNIVFVLCDDLGWGELGCYGQQIIKTPNLDRMAADGVRFTDYHSPAPICAPSRCSMLTGLHQGHARVRHNTINDMPAVVQASLRPEDVTFGEVLQSAGYTTGLFGKWGFGPDDRAPMAVACGCEDEGHSSHPLQQGFDEFNGFIYHHHATSGYWTDYWWEGNRRVDIPQNAGGAKGLYMPDEYTRRGLAFIERQAATGRPFAAWFSTILPHTPNEVPDFSQYDDLPYANDTKKHAAMVSKADTHVGMVLDTLDRLGIADNTIVVFTSDNGAHDETAVYGGTDPIPTAGVTSAADTVIFNSTGPYRGVKQNLYEGGIRVPLVVWGPGVLGDQSRRAVSDHRCAGYDLLATFADFAGADVPVPTDGISLKPLLEGRPGAQRPHDYLYWERFKGGAPTALYFANEHGRQGHFAQAVRKDEWKLIRWAPGTQRDGSVDVNPVGSGSGTAVPVVKVPREQWQVELYNLADDEGETNDLSMNNAAKVGELAALMDAAHVDPPPGTEEGGA